MEKLLDFLADWYILWIVITLLLLFALVGYFVERKRKKTSPFKINNKKIDIEEEKVDIESLKNMSGNLSLADALNKNTIVNNGANNNAQNINAQAGNVNSPNDTQNNQPLQ